MSTIMTVTEGPLAIFAETDGRTLVYSGENTLEAHRQARAAADSASDSQAWAEGVRPGGFGTRSAREVAETMTYTGLTAAGLYASRLAMAAVTSPNGGESALVADEARAFVFNSGDMSAAVSGDLTGRLVIPRAGGNGSDGAWEMAVGAEYLIDHLGCLGDDTTDNSTNLQRIVDTLALRHPKGFVLKARQGSRFRLVKAIDLPGNCVLDGIHFTNDGKRYFLTVNASVTAANAFTQFSENITIRNCTFTADIKDSSLALYAVNVRKLRLLNNTGTNTGGFVITHGAEHLNIYSRTNGSETVDPAVVAGFSATDPDYALNEDILVQGNSFTSNTFGGTLLRFNFARRVVVSGNSSVLSGAISWWGGGAKIDEGGAFSMHRRVRHVTIMNNFIEGASAAIYGNCGEHITIVGNVAKNVTDTAFDPEGCKHVFVGNNVVHNAGNFCLSVFYAGYGIQFANNLCIQDGGGTNISNTLYGGLGSVGTQAGTAFMAFQSGTTSLIDGIKVLIRNNQFLWLGPQTSYGRHVPGYGRTVVWEGNYHLNVQGNYGNSLSWNPSVIGNRHEFTYALASAVDLVSVQTTVSDTCQVRHNDIFIDAAMPTGTRALYCVLASASAQSMAITNNTIRLGTNGSLPNSGTGSSLVVFRDRDDVRNGIFRLTGNECPHIADISKLGNSAVYYEGNTNALGAPIPTPTTISGYNLAKHSRIWNDNPAASGLALQVATNTMFISAPLFAASTAYQQYAVFRTSAGNVYRVTNGSGGTSGTTEPTGTGLTITNGTLTVRYIGIVETWAKLNYAA